MNLDTSTQAQPTSQPIPSTRWTIDGSHTTVGFSVRHMMITNVRGELQLTEGSVEYDSRNPERAKVVASVDVGTIDTHEPKRDAHLRSADFFDADNHPRMTFVSRAVRLLGGDRLALDGDLTIRGVTRPVTFDVVDVTAPRKDPWGNQRIGASARAKIRRSEFGMTWNGVLEAGGLLVSDDVTITIDVSLIRVA